MKWGALAVALAWLALSALAVGCTPWSLPLGQAAAADGTVLCIYERGGKSPYEQIALARWKPE